MNLTPVARAPFAAAFMRAVAPRSASRRAVVSAAVQRGFTIIELIIVVAIGAVLATIAIPALRDTLNNTRQSSALGLLMSDLNLARGDAIKRNSRMLVCVRDVAGTDCGAGTNWQAGWVVCIEGALANQCAASTATDPNPVVVRPPFDAALTLNASAAVIRFNPNSSQGVGGVAATLTLGGTWSGAVNRVVTVAGTGNISRQ